MAHRLISLSVLNRNLYIYIVGPVCPWQFVMDSTHLDRPLKTTLSILQELLLMHEGHSLAPCYAVENFRDVLYEHLVKFLQPWSSAPRMFLSLLWRHDAYICGDASTRYLLGLPAITDSPSSSMLHIICPTSRKQNSMESIGDWLENCEYYRYVLTWVPVSASKSSLGEKSDSFPILLHQAVGPRLMNAFST